MKICYQIKNGIEYAKTEGSSYRVGDKVLKKDYCAIIGLNQKGLENQGILA